MNARGDTVHIDCLISQLPPFSQFYLPISALLYGPLGTGKTSLTFKIAGIFNLDIYSVTLVEPTITKAQLDSLFDELPKRCLVLLEDIDSAGLVVRGSERSNYPPELATNQPTIDDVLSYNSTSRISFLSVIDGIASYEGQILIMITNSERSIMLCSNWIELICVFTLN